MKIWLAGAAIATVPALMGVFNGASVLGIILMSWTIVRVVKERGWL